MTSIHTAHVSATLQRKNEQIDVKNVPENATKTAKSELTPTSGTQQTAKSVNSAHSAKTSAMSSALPPIASSATQLERLLNQLPILQRLFSPLLTGLATPGTTNADTKTPMLTTPLQHLISQLLQPSSQSTLINWLQQGAGKQALAQLIRQLAEPGSELRRWLSQLPPHQQEEFSALLRLAGEQRLATPTPASQDTLVLMWPMLTPNGREAFLEIQREARSTEKNPQKKPKWRIRLRLPVGNADNVYVQAGWDGDELSLLFESENPALLERTRLLSPFLNQRLESMGIQTVSSEFRRHVEEPESTYTDSGSGLNITV